MGARKFMPVSPAVWNRRVLRLGKDTVIVYFYLLTNKHRNSEGLYHLPRAYIVGDLGGSGVTAEAIDKALVDLRGEGLIDYDDEVDVVLIPDALLLQPPGSPLQIEGAIKKLRDVPKSRLLREFYLRALAYCPEKPNAKGQFLHTVLEETFPELQEPFTQVTTVEEPLHDTSSSAGSESESGVKGKGMGGRPLSVVQPNGSRPLDPSTLNAQEEW